MAEAAVTIEEVAPEARLLFHCAPSDRAVAAAALALELPKTMLRTGFANGWHALHLSPDEWLLIGPLSEAAAMLDRLERDANGFALSMVDISERNVGVTLSGPFAADLLNAGCALDLGNDAFPIGTCTRTLFGKADILLWRTGDEPTFRVEYARSFADYVRRYLDTAMADVGL